MARDRRRGAVLAVLGLAAGAVVLDLAPLDLAAIRLGPLSLLWWYAAVAAPVAAAAITVAALLRDGA